MWLSLGLIVVQTLQTASFLGSSFKVISEMDNIIFELEIIFSLSTRSLLDCSRKCETNGTCLSFQYSPLIGQCRLFNTIFLHRDAGVYDIGWQYYIASNSMYTFIVWHGLVGHNLICLSKGRFVYALPLSGFSRCSIQVLYPDS